MPSILNQELHTSAEDIDLETLGFFYFISHSIWTVGTIKLFKGSAKNYLVDNLIV